MQLMQTIEKETSFRYNGDPFTWCLYQLVDFGRRIYSFILFIQTVKKETMYFNIENLLWIVDIDGCITLDIKTL